MSFIGCLIKPLAYVSLPLYLIRKIANQPTPSPLRYYARLFVYVGTLVTVASCSFFVAAGMSIVGRSNEVNYIVARIFYGIAHRALDLKVEVEGEEFIETRPAVYMANHQSMIDILILGRVFPKKACIMAKKSLQFTPLGPFMILSGNIFIDRANNASAVQSLHAAGERMKKDGLSLWMFPEGTRHMSEEPCMLPFKKGGFHLAIDAGIPIVPIIVENYWSIYRKGVFETGVIKVKILQPIPTTSMASADVHILADRVRDAMLATLYDISPEVPSEKSIDPVQLNPVVFSEKSQKEATPSPPASPSEQKSELIPPLDTPEPLLAPSIGSSPYSVDSTLMSTGSSSSLACSSTSIRGKEDGTETEEDGDMILVGRPPK